MAGKLPCQSHPDAKRTGQTLLLRTPTRVPVKERVCLQNGGNL